MLILLVMGISPLLREPAFINSQRRASVLTICAAHQSILHCGNAHAYIDVTSQVAYSADFLSMWKLEVSVEVSLCLFYFVKDYGKFNLFYNCFFLSCSCYYPELFSSFGVWFICPSFIILSSKVLIFD